MAADTENINLFKSHIKLAITERLLLDYSYVKLKYFDTVINVLNC